MSLSVNNMNNEDLLEVRAVCVTVTNRQRLEAHINKIIYMDTIVSDVTPKVKSGLVRRYKSK